MKTVKFAKEDFLTNLLNDEKFSQNEEMIVDECATFYVASILNLTNLLYNTLYELFTNKELLIKSKNEI
jgi:cytochrome P450